MIGRACGDRLNSDKDDSDGTNKTARDGACAIARQNQVALSARTVAALGPSLASCPPPRSSPVGPVFCDR